MNLKKPFLSLMVFLFAATGLLAQTPAKFTVPGTSVTASANDGNVPANTVDGSLSTRWSAEGDGQWIRYDLGSSKTVSYVKLAWHQGNTRTSTFDVQVSPDASAWSTVYSGTSSGSTTALETYDFTDTAGRYVRIVGHGNSSGNGWNSITETEIWGTTAAQVAAPGFSPGGGTYSSAQSVTITSSTSGAAIRYTTNGTNPTSTSGTVYSGPVAISATSTLKAIAYASGLTDSTVTSASYTISTGGGGGSVPLTLEAESVSADPAYWSSISDANASGGTGLQALVNSTGFAPAGGGLVYSFNLGTASTIYLQIKARAANGSSDSAWVRLDGGAWSQFVFDATGAYTWRNKSYSSVASGNHTVEIRVREAGAVIDLVAVTLNTSTPPPVGGGGGTVAAPAFSPAAGTYTSAQSVTITSATSGATIRYTTNGTNPTATSGTVYASPVSISATSTLKAIAYKSGMTDSTVTSGAYTINAPAAVAAPTFSPPAGTYTSAQSVTIASTTSGATIRYTTNGTNPTSTSGTVYASPVSISATSTLKAIAYKSGMTDSAVTTGAYTINTGGGPLDPNAPPGDNFDLSKWKITLPINDAEEHSAAELVAGYEHAEHFYTDPVTGGMVFHCPNLGDTTGGSTYSRSELREMLAPTGSATAANNNWVLSTSSTSAKNAAGGVDGTMVAVLSVDHVSTTGDSSKVGRVVVGQIHAPDSEIIRLYYHKRPTDTRGAIYFGHDTPSNSNSYHAIIGDPDNLDPAGGILLGELWSYEIKVVGQTMTVKVTPDGQPTVTVTFPLESGYNNLSQYFKAGVYNQNNTGTSTDYVQATFYWLTHTHP